MLEKTIEIDNISIVAELSGSFDKNIKALEQAFEVSVNLFDSTLTIRGDEASVDLCTIAVNSLIDIVTSNGAADEQTVQYCIALAQKGVSYDTALVSDNHVIITASGKPVKAKTEGQKKYLNAIRDNQIIFCIGPAGTGKTYLAVAMAVKALKNHDVSRIILTRPAVEAGEKLGFLPGDLQNKVDPYLRPLYDALFDIMGPETFQKNQEKGIIEVAPLAYMRGRTLDSSFIILDEAQNTTAEQMKMFLTRFGFGSKMVVNGDITQMDLPDGKISGLQDATIILRNIDSIATIHLGNQDVVRAKIVIDIVNAYENNHKGKQGKHDK